MRPGSGDPARRLGEILSSLKIVNVKITPSIDDGRPDMARFLSVTLASGDQKLALAGLFDHPEVEIVLPEPDATP